MMSGRTTARRAAALLAWCALVTGASAVVTTPAVAAVPTGTMSAGTVTDGRSLLYVNNPDSLRNTDLAEAGRSISGHHLTAGGVYRAYFAHVNRTSPAVSLHYGIRLTNGRSTATVVTRTRSVWRAGAAGIGGAALADFFNGSENTTITVPGQGQAWLYRSDQLGSGLPAAVNQYLVGAADFTTTGTLVAEVLAWSTSLPTGGSYTYPGYAIDLRDGQAQHRFDKGLSPISAATLTITSTLHTGKVEDQLLSATAGGNTACPTNSYANTGWATNLNHLLNAGALGGDLVSLTTPEGPLVTPCVNSPFGGGKPNLRNWGVGYTVQLTVDNQSYAPRTLALVASGIGGAVNVAYRPPGGTTWQSALVGDLASFTWATVTAPPGLSTFTASFAVSGPGPAGLLHRLRTTG
ncbi:hypothetical protein ABZ436_09980 [Micromonospora matsumotoense]|uniref:hypothetical protein n=1 Tax=Micromonospora matsumotoense TaxID=121616 RepID=UPI0033D0DCA0